MDVILLEKVDNLGSLGDKVAVRPGYGRNFLIPTGRAVAATAENLKAFEARRAELEKQAAERLAAAQARKEKLDGLAIEIRHRAGDQGRLFGSVGTSDVALAVNALGSFAFGALVALCRSRDTFSAAQETILLVGLLGGFTTYSTFAFHSAEMLSHGRFLTAAAYILGTNLSGLAAVWAGLRLFGRAG